MERIYSSSCELSDTAALFFAAPVHLRLFITSDCTSELREFHQNGIVYLEQKEYTGL